MKVPYSWLKDFVPVEAPPDEVGRRLTMLGLEVESIAQVDDDQVLDVQATSNRGDGLSILGVAREVAAAFELPLTLPSAAVREAGEPAAALASVRVDDPDLCPRYSARVMTELEVKTSPPWVIHRLLRCGMRPINAVVDATNYVMLELGQPLHAFDCDLIAPGPDGRAAVIVRTAREGEPLTTLDGVERKLAAGMLVIADPERAIALAGVMGGANTEVSWSTTRVLLESAHFNRVSVRRTRKALELDTEASYRFERIVDPGGTVAALDRVAAIIADACGGKVARGITDQYPKAILPVTIELRPRRANQLLGTRLSKARMAALLRRLQLEVEQGEALRVTCPTYRPDLQAEIDLVEEVARVHGYDRIPATVTGGAGAPGRQAPELEFDLRVKQALMACGLNEALSYTLTDAGVFDRLHLPPGHPRRRALRVKNPKSEEYTVLRTTMLDSMLSALAHNARRGVSDVALFEVGRVYLPVPSAVEGRREQDDLPHERRSAGIAVMGGAWSSRWGLDPAATRADFYSLKGIVEQVASNLCEGDLDFAALSHPSLREGHAAAVRLDGEEIGLLGAPSVAVRDHYDLPDGAYVAELNLEAMMRRARGHAQSRRLSRYPAVRRDIALIIPGGVLAREVEQVIRRQAGENLERVDLFDLYTGRPVPAGYKSLAYALAFRHAERTLTDEEADAALTNIKDGLRAELNAQIRE
ncbi:MAG TPA: phenylalanine--tRNA ligase subunit beta [Armatimonadota bacterium]|nr:phenylalanine--tRNA ligase subunit beta [Armatimonadota bacterium]